MVNLLDFLKSVLGGTSKIYAGLYNGTPVQIYPSSGVDYNTVAMTVIRGTSTGNYPVTTAVSNISTNMNKVYNNTKYHYKAEIGKTVEFDFTVTVSNYNTPGKFSSLSDGSYEVSGDSANVALINMIQGTYTGATYSVIFPTAITVACDSVLGDYLSFRVFTNINAAYGFSLKHLPKTINGQWLRPGTYTGHYTITITNTNAYSSQYYYDTVGGSKTYNLTQKLTVISS